RDFHVTGVQTCALPIYVLGKGVQHRRDRFDGRIGVGPVIGKHAEGDAAKHDRRHVAQLAELVFIGFTQAAGVGEEIDAAVLVRGIAIDTDDLLDDELAHGGSRGYSREGRRPAGANGNGNPAPARRRDEAAGREPRSGDSRGPARADDKLGPWLTKRSTW